MRRNIRRRLRRNRGRDNGLRWHLFHLADRAFQPDLAEGSPGALPSLLPLCLRRPIGGLRRFDAPAGDEWGQGKVEQAIEAKGSHAINHRPHQGMKSKAELFLNAQSNQIYSVIFVPMGVVFDVINHVPSTNTSPVHIFRIPCFISVKNWTKSTRQGPLRNVNLSSSWFARKVSASYREYDLKFAIKYSRPHLLAKH